MLYLIINKIDNTHEFVCGLVVSTNVNKLQAVYVNNVNTNKCRNRLFITSQQWHTIGSKNIDIQQWIVIVQQNIDSQHSHVIVDIIRYKNHFL